MDGPQQELQRIERALAGDERARAALYAACAPRLAAYFLRSGFARADADDLLQETFLRAFRSLATFDPGRGAFGAWLGAIARNVARKRWGRQAAPENFDPDLAEAVLTGGEDPAASAATREEADALRDCIARLPEQLRHVVHLRYVEGRTTRGVAAAAGMPEATARSRLAEARARLRACLGGKGIEA